MFRAYLAFWSGKPGRAGDGRQLVGMDVPGYPHPIQLRLCTSDVFAFDQVFYEEEYAPLTRLADPRVIVDCGANIGCTSAYLLHHYPNAKLIAVEPDAGNNELCARNVRPFGPRAEVIQAGVWSHPTSLRVERGRFRDGREWSFQVRECAPGEPAEVQAVSIPSLLLRAGAERIDILKIDIEGAELTLFAAGDLDWLDRVECLAVETHDPACLNAVLRAVQRYSFPHVTRLRETLFCFRRSAVSPGLAQPG